MAAEKKIGVVIPVYNAKRYLRQCIQSVLNQTFQDFCLVLVDDGSSDGSGKICDTYAAKDSRVCVIHQPNQGAFAARNALIARGEIVRLPHDTPERAAGHGPPTGWQANSRCRDAGRRYRSDKLLNPFWTK